MKKFSTLTSDQKKLRVIFIIALIIGICTQIIYLKTNIEKGLALNLILFADSLIVGLIGFAFSFFAIIVALMQKDKRVL